MILISERVIVDISQHDDSLVNVIVSEVPLRFLKASTEGGTAQLEMTVNEAKTRLFILLANVVRLNYCFCTIFEYY